MWDLRRENACFSHKWEIHEEKTGDFQVKWEICEQETSFSLKWGICEEKTHDVSQNGGFAKRKRVIFA